MTYGTPKVFSGSAITPEELLVLAEFAAPSHFITNEHRADAAENLAQWTDHEAPTILAALMLAQARDVRPSVTELLRAAALATSDLKVIALAS